MALSTEVIDRLRALVERYQELSELMAQPDVVSNLDRLKALAKEQADSEELVMAFRGYESTQQELTDARALVDESSDDEMQEMAAEEAAELEQKLETQEEILKRLLAPKDPRDGKDVIVEIRAGTGGEEAGLFAADLYRMY